MHLSENEGIEDKVFVVTGGLGFVGSALCLELLRRGARQVNAFDLRSTSPWSLLLTSRGVHFIQGDLTRKTDVEKALRGVDCVFHLASFGMSGKEMLQFGRVDEVNISGTCHVLESCIEFGIKRLVYVSTYNVVFGGKEILNGNETLPYFSIDEHVDSYGRSKSIAEQLVLKYNGRPLKTDNKRRLYTCAIRPAAIYGPGEERHLPRIITFAKLGLLPFRIGDANVKTDWVYVDNLVLSLILASMGLLDDIDVNREHPVAAGQAYFISDGSPVNSFEFLKPLLRSLDYDLPKVSLSVDHALLLGRFISGIYTILYPWLNRRWLPQPVILPAEVYKVGVTHYFSYLKAKQELGYVPMVTPKEGMAATISYFQEKKKKELDGPTIYAWLFAVVGMLMLFCSAYLPDIGPVPFFRAIHLFFMRSMRTIRVVFLLAAAAHISEAIYAWFLAKRVDPANAKGWFWQTFALGIFSLRFLLKRANKLLFTVLYRVPWIIRWDYSVSYRDENEYFQAPQELTYGEISAEIISEGMLLCNELKIHKQMRSDKITGKQILGDFCEQLRYNSIRKKKFESDLINQKFLLRIDCKSAKEILAKDVKNIASKQIFARFFNFVFRTNYRATNEFAM